MGSWKVSRYHYHLGLVSEGSGKAGLISESSLRYVLCNKLLRCSIVRLSNIRAIDLQLDAIVSMTQSMHRSFHFTLYARRQIHKYIIGMHSPTILITPHQTISVRGVGPDIPSALQEPPEFPFCAGRPDNKGGGLIAGENLPCSAPPVCKERLTSANHMVLVLSPRCEASSYRCLRSLIRLLLGWATIYNESRRWLSSILRKRYMVREDYRNWKRTHWPRGNRISQSAPRNNLFLGTI
jgi:hypothetical protein